MTNPPNIMQPGTWIVLAIVIACITGALVGVVVHVLASRIKWRTLPLPGLLLLVSSPPDVSDNTLAGNFLRALEALEPVWPRAAMLAVLRKTPLHVLVKPVAKWQNVAFEWVGGEQDGDVLRVDKPMSSLCHELAHYMEQALDSSRDDAHAAWRAKGIWLADETYRKGTP